MADPTVEKQTYGAFERLLYIFLIPLIFVTILLGVLLSLFDYDVMNSLLKVANKIPVIEKVIPDPKSATVPAKATAPAAPVSEEEEVAAASQELQKQIAALQADLKQATESGADKDKQIKELKGQLAVMEEKIKNKTQTDEQYKVQIQQLASVYAKMQPSKSAPVLEKLTLKEQVLVLSEMKPDDRVKILEKMNPTIAAEASIALKDVVLAKDLQISALQERLKVQAAESKPVEPPAMTKDELGQTFAEMVPKSAASILSVLNGANPAKVISILSSMDNASRAKVLAAIADTNKELAASLSAKLAP